MANLNFPDPGVSTTYTAAGVTWTWNATLGVWSSQNVIEQYPPVQVKSSAPLIKEEGDLWWDTSGDGALYLWDGSSWLPVDDTSLDDRYVQNNNPSNQFSVYYNETWVDDDDRYLFSNWNNYNFLP